MGSPQPAPPTPPDRATGLVIALGKLSRQLLRGLLPGSRRPGTRELRELVRYRTKLVSMRASLKSQAHSVMAKEGVLPTLTDMFGPAGQKALDEMTLGRAYAIRMESLRDLIEAYDAQVSMLEHNRREEWTVWASIRWRRVEPERQPVLVSATPRTPRWLRRRQPYGDFRYLPICAIDEAGEGRQNEHP